MKFEFRFEIDVEEESLTPGVMWQLMDKMRSSLSGISGVKVGVCSSIPASIISGLRIGLSRE